MEERIQELSNEFDELCNRLHQSSDQGKFMDPNLYHELAGTLAAFSNLARYMYIKLSIMKEEEEEDLDE